VPTDRGAHPGLKVVALVAGMVAGADSIEDMHLLRHGGMGRLFARAYAPSMLGSFLRSFRFGHVRQLDAVAARLGREPGRAHAAAARCRADRLPRRRCHGASHLRLRQADIPWRNWSSCGGEGVSWPGGCFVVGGPGVEAAVEDAERAARTSCVSCNGSTGELRLGDHDVAGNVRSTPLCGFHHLEHRK
jgi:hypothetical protein